MLLPELLSAAETQDLKDAEGGHDLRARDAIHQFLSSFHRITGLQLVVDHDYLGSLAEIVFLYLDHLLAVLPTEIVPVNLTREVASLSDRYKWHAEKLR